MIFESSGIEDPEPIEVKVFEVHQPIGLFYVGVMKACDLTFIAYADTRRQNEREIESFSGDIENCFGQTTRDTSKYAPGSELNFTRGNGGARVEIETLSGEISICDR